MQSEPIEAPAADATRTGPLQKTFEWLFGYDYFIAHRSTDGKAYASALYDELTAKGNELECFLDVKHYGAGGGLTTMQARALKKTSRLVVIVTPHAHHADARYVRSEVEEFRRLHPYGNIVPIGTWETLTKEQSPNSLLLPLIPHPPDKLCILESAEQLRAGKPSAEAVAKLLNDFSEERRATRRLHGICGVAVLLFVLLLAAVGFGIYASRKRSEALTQTTIAKAQRSIAETAQAGAEDALTRSFVRTIGADSRDFLPSAMEWEALWGLSELGPTNGSVRKRVIRDWMQTTDSSLRALGHDSRSLHAAIGLNPSLATCLKSEIDESAARLIVALENPWDINSERTSMGLAALAAHMTPDQAAAFANRLTVALEKAGESHFYWLSSVGGVLAVLTARIHGPEADSLTKRGAEVLVRALEDPKESRAQFLSHLCEALSALAARMSPDEVATMAGRLTVAADRSARFSNRVYFLRNEVSALSGGIKAGDVARAAESMAKTLEAAPETDLPMLLASGRKLSVLASHLDPQNAAPVAGRGAAVLAKLFMHRLRNAEPPNDDRGYLPNLAEVLSGLASHTSSDDAAALTEEVLPALENASVPEHVIALGTVLSTLVARIEPSHAANIAGRGSVVLEKTMSQLNAGQFNDLLLMGKLSVIAVCMQPGDASVARRGSEILAKAISDPHISEAASLKELGNILPSLAASTAPNDAFGIADGLSKVLEYPGETKSMRLRVLGQVLTALGPRMRPSDCALVAQRLAKALTNPQETSPDRLSGLGKALTAMAAQIPSAHQSRLLGLSHLFINPVEPSRLGNEEGTQQAQLVTKVCRSLTVRELTEVLKWPFCVGEVQRLVLQELGKKTARTFGGDVWKFVEQAESLGITNVAMPPKRPRAEDTAKELEALRSIASGAQEPSPDAATKPSFFRP